MKQRKGVAGSSFGKSCGFLVESSEILFGQFRLSTSEILVFSRSELPSEIKLKIIGTGLSGLVGSRIVELLQDKHEFVDFSLDSGIDITDFSALQSAFAKHQDAEVVLHLAAFTNVSAAHEQTGDKDGLCYRINVTGTENIARLCAEKAKYLIHLSTDFVFDGKNPPAGGYTEEDQPKPIEWYGQTKLWAEEKVQALTQSWLILRIAFPYKAKPAPPKLEPKVKPDLIRKIREKLEAGETMAMFTDQIITPTFIDDIASAIDQAVVRQPKGLYHLVGSSSLSPFALAQKVAETFELDLRNVKPALLAEFMKTDPRPRQPKMALSNQELQKDLKIKMKTIDEGLGEIKKQLS
jgi:dTDP-4-dehydrorhamnose reductase